MGWKELKTALSPQITGTKPLQIKPKNLCADYCF